MRDEDAILERKNKLEMKMDSRSRNGNEVVYAFQLLIR